ncbi:MAG: NAD(P)-dependent alcohol dehydrogenase [Thermoplasmatota archaeon]
MDDYGPPEVLKIKDFPKPVPKDNEILVRVNATTVNFGDLIARNFKNIPLRELHMPLPLMLFARLSFGWSKPKVRILGSEFSGVVESVGKNVTKFSIGDEVFGYPGQRMGAYAEYLTMAEDKMVGLKPKNMTHPEAACIPYGAIMALSHLRKVSIRPGQKVLVNGASGGIGSAGVQLAKYYGAEVTGVCGTNRVEFVKALGADKVIDYTKEDFTGNGETYDVIYDILGKSTFSKCKGSLKENGTYLLASFKMKKVFQMMMTKFGNGKKVICALAGEDPGEMDLIRKLAEEGHIKTVIDRAFPFEQAADAHGYVESGKKKGNVVIGVLEEVSK